MIRKGYAELASGREKSKRVSLRLDLLGGLSQDL